ncbi:MAG: hypothetical protein AAB447_01410 [Patescibacteria group bacterium]
MTNTVLQQTHTTQKAVFALGIFCIILSCVYGYFIQMTIVTVVAREKMGTTIRELRSQTAQMENQHFALDQAITVDYAQAIGFKEPVNIAYVERGVVSGLSVYHYAR